MRETKQLEFKEMISNTFLKTVSAYANYGTGEILFGIADDGSTKGIENPEKACLDIENRINDNIDPVPEYTLQINEKTSVITLTVQEGLHKPYLYKAKAYRRNDSATIEADRLELTRLILEGQDMAFEELPAKNQALSFSILEEKLKEVLGLEIFSQDTLKTLELYHDRGGLNHAAELLADTNSFSGIEMVRFGSSINIILDRETHEHESILKQYDKALRFYRKYYQYERIQGAFRESESLIPEEAFREAAANALVHRTWDIQASISIAMFPDRIEITSPGGLPRGMDEADYLRGGISILRNRIIGNIFFRLRMIERFGTGIRRINEAYANSEVKPRYEILENSIRIILPVMQSSNGLREDEYRVYSLLRDRSISSSAIMEASGFGKSRVLAILKRLTAAGYVRSTGSGRGTRYSAAGKTNLSESIYQNENEES